MVETMINNVGNEVNVFKRNEKKICGKGSFTT